ncbi:hypothetical protein GCM10025868_36550 [Angustibacter aerolatus]|uniref:Uncharacterized protein n=1 Tax=Angustibacter aerolatus TaxID=1162965 RepID=A0ABQ6JNS6_9ACTN|nr:hypothetical protein GCM10025868_36550 [Angustibacter aerolatus]
MAAGSRLRWSWYDGTTSSFVGSVFVGVGFVFRIEAMVVPASAGLASTGCTASAAAVAVSATRVGIADERVEGWR